jgi:hypothetical protein
VFVCQPNVFRPNGFRPKDDSPLVTEIESRISLAPFKKSALMQKTFFLWHQHKEERRDSLFSFYDVSSKEHF